MAKKIGIGCAGFSNTYGKRSLESLRSVVNLAMKNNIKYFDTASYYGSSEKILGNVMRPYPRSSYILSTQVGRFQNKKNPNGYFDFSRKAIINSVHNSLSRLNTDYLDVVHCHHIEYCHPNQLIKETLPALNELRKDGVVKNIGISGYPLNALSYIIHKNNLEKNPIQIDYITSYSNYTLQNTLLEKFPKINNVKIVNAEILGMGLLTMEGPQKWHPASEKLRSAGQKAASYCLEKENKDISEIATKFALESKVSDITLVEAYSESQLEKILEWSLDKVDRGIINNIQGIFNKANFKNKLWGPQFLQFSRPQQKIYYVWPN